MQHEENVVFILQQAVKYFKIKVTKTTVKEFLLSHPYYPSLKSVCDALTKWKVENYPLSLELNEIQNLEMPFIAHLKTSGGMLVYVQEIKDGDAFYLKSGNKVIQENFEKFSEKLSGAVVVLEGTKDSGEKEYRKKHQDEILNKSLLPLGIITWVILGAYFVFNGTIDLQPGYLLWSLMFTKIIGLTASIFLVLHEIKVHIPLSDKICGFSSKTDCDTVLSSKASRLFGWINWADVGLIYFSGTILFLLGAKSSDNLWPLAIISVLALPYPIFSIYYQAFKAKKWCPFCLTVQLALIAEFVILLPYLRIGFFAVPDIIRWITFLLIPGTIWLFFKSSLDKEVDFKQEHFSFLGFKRNPDVFKFLLQQNGYIEIPVNNDSLILGNPNAPVTVTAFLSPYCKPCADAFKELRMLVDNCNDVKINMILSIYSDEALKLINHVYYHYYNEGSEATIEYLSKWYSTNKDLRKSLYENDLPEGFDIAEVTGKTNKELFEKLKITGTPTVFIQGYKFPNQYDYKDIEFYIDDIKKIHLESKRQEACANCH